MRKLLIGIALGVCALGANAANSYFITSYGVNGPNAIGWGDVDPSTSFVSAQALCDAFDDAAIRSENKSLYGQNNPNQSATAVVIGSGNSGGCAWDVTDKSGTLRSDTAHNWVHWGLQAGPASPLPTPPADTGGLSKKKWSGLFYILDLAF